MDAQNTQNAQHAQSLPARQAGQEAQGAVFHTNLDTSLLKLIAIAAMLADHIGSAFFPAVPVFRWIGRLAFPLFCYCMTVGPVYTHNIRRYLGRLWNSNFSNVMVGSGEKR